MKLPFIWTQAPGETRKILLALDERGSPCSLVLGYVDTDRLTGKAFGVCKVPGDIGGDAIGDYEAVENAQVAMINVVISRLIEQLGRRWP
jgi:hypothetical protein